MSDAVVEGRPSWVLKLIVFFPHLASSWNKSPSEIPVMALFFGPLQMVWTVSLRSTTDKIKFNTAYIFMPFLEVDLQFYNQSWCFWIASKNYFLKMKNRHSQGEKKRLCLEKQVVGSTAVSQQTKQTNPNTFHPPLVSIRMQALWVKVKCSEVERNCRFILFCRLRGTTFGSTPMWRWEFFCLRKNFIKKTCDLEIK